MFVIKMEKAKDPLNIDMYCKDKFISQRYIDPDLLENNTDIHQNLIKDLRRYGEKTSLNYLSFISPEYWTTPNQKHISPLIHLFSTKMAFKQLCKEYYGSLIESERCAYLYA